MNRNELEQWMKESLGKKEFTPDEAGWNKLQDAMRPPARKKFIFPIVTGMKIAASVALLVTAGTSIYLTQRKSHPPFIETIQNPEKAAVTSNQSLKEISITPADTPIQLAHKAFSKTRSTPLIAHTTESATTAASALVADSNTSAFPDDSRKQGDQEMPVKKTFNHTPNLAVMWPENEDKKKGALNVGVAAQAGRASVGNMQYQIGVVAHKSFSGKFYAEATLAFASTDVSYNQPNKFRSVSVNNGTSSSVEEKSINAQYGKNIISLGISPSIGYRLTRNIALTGGVALYRNLDQSLALKNEETIDAAALTNDVIANTKSINQWDAGLTGSATYDVTRQFAINLQYRYGLSTYMYFDNQAIRNSGLNVGLKYLFGRR